MADNLDDGEFWLPPQFLTDDDTSFNIHHNLNRNNNNVKSDDVSRTLFPYLSSSSETESDEEDHLAELTRRVALELDLHSAKPKVGFGSGSPQSTLCAVGSSGKGSSPNGAVSQVNVQRETWDLLRAAAGEVERMCLSENDRYGYSFLLNAPAVPAAHSPGLGFAAPSGVNTDAVGLGFYNQQQLQIAQILRQQQLAKQQQQRQMVPNSGRNNSNNVRGGNMGLCMGLSSSAWPRGSGGMRAVFLAGKRESTGTGVFLPRSVDTRIEPRKKPACNTALVPDRVAKALNLNLEGVVGGKVQHKPRFNGENGSTVSKGRSNHHHHNQKRNNNQKPQQTQALNNHEIQLPKEWTY
ncbi:unnamed protein product [Sphenostylis stenocarpa]|uniref:Uncharacterized protein n=1 Tax=Sphenostylis stenocarpa TaxID=92480 RepID=A0AA86SAP7_9FABA|nr:unnamed protein product [Sphenostylis stenocarpa]